MSIELIAIIGVLFFLVFLFFYIFKFQNLIENRFALIEFNIDQLVKDIGEVNKKIKNLENKESIVNHKELIEIEEILSNLIDNLNSLEYKQKKHYKELSEKIESLKNFIKPNLNVSLDENDKKRIKEMIKDGFSVEEISKELRIPTGEIEFIIKMDKIR